MTTTDSVEFPAQIAHPSFLRRTASLLFILILFAAYSVISHSAASRGPKVGAANAERLLRLESRFGIDGETAFQRAMLPHEWVVRFANWYYVIGFMPIIAAGVLLSFWLAPSVLARWQRIFAISLMFALIGYASYPLAPPRLLGVSEGFVDTLLLYGPHYYGNSAGKSMFNLYGLLPDTVNIYAAMPSMHVAWSVIAGVLIAASFRHRWWAVGLAVLHPVLMSVSVVVTANHYVLDVVAGLIVLAVSIGLYESIAVWRRGTSPNPTVAFQ